MVSGSILENGYKATSRWKTILLSISKKEVFYNFWETKLKPFSMKVRQRVQNYLNQNLIIESFLENGFEAPLRSKTNVMSIWKGYISFFRKFLSGEVETTFRESEAKRSKLFKSKFRHRNLLTKLPRSFLEFHKQYCVCLNIAFLSFLQISYWGRWNHFLAKWGKEFKIISIKVWS